MHNKTYVKEIKGSVFYDIDNDGVMGNSDQALKGIGIKLFKITYKKTRDIEDNDVCISRENLILKTKTDDNGEFCFIVNAGTYSISLDINTLPNGKGVIEKNKLVHIADTSKINFVVRDIAKINIENDHIDMKIGEQIQIHPIARDKKGNILEACMNLLSISNDLNIHSNFCRSIPKHFRNHIVDISIEAGNIKRNVNVNIKLPDLCSTDRVNLAYDLGLIDEVTKFKYLIYALDNSFKLPQEYRSRKPIKSGTGVIEELYGYLKNRNIDTVVSNSLRQITSASKPKLDKTYRSLSGFFNIHYTLTGKNAVVLSPGDSKTIPLYIKQMGEAFDHVKTVTCQIRGFREPILERGNTVYDIYVYDLKGKYGVTYSSSIYTGRNVKNKTASSYICIDNNYSKQKGFEKNWLDCMKVTAAHEFFHAVQYSYNLEADSWWKEASSTWNEDEIYTGINDYIRYIGNYLNAPYKPLDESSYSGVIFVKFLSENYGGYNIIKRIWEAHSISNNNSIQIIDRVIRNSFIGKDIGTLFNQFSTYNINPAQYYKDGSSWNIAVIAQHSYDNYPIVTANGQLNHLSSNYQLFKPSSSDSKSIKIIIESDDDDARWGFKLQKRSNSSKKFYLTEINSQGLSRVEIEIINFGTVYDEVWFIPSNLETNRNRLQYSYSARLY
jgi:hypothetical protein